MTLAQAFFVPKIALRIWTLAFFKFASGGGRFQTCPHTRLKYNFRQSPFRMIGPKYRINLYRRRVVLVNIDSELEIMNNRIATNLIIKIGALLLLTLLGFNPTPQVQAAPVSPLLRFASGGHVLGFAGDGFYLSNGAYSFKTTFVGARPAMPQSDANSALAGGDGLAPLLGQVSYPNLWPGITLVYDRGDGLARSTYTVAAGSDPAAIRLRYNVPVQVNTDGSLTLSFAAGTLTESAPLAWQVIDGQRIPVDIAFQVSPLAAENSAEVGFALGEYDSRHLLLIDPTLTWNTFLGGAAGDDEGYSIALDNSGNLYVAGASYAAWGGGGSDPTPTRPYSAKEDAFVARLDTAGNLVWLTFLGGGEADKALSIAVADGSVFVAGFTSSAWTAPAPGVVNPYQSGNGIDAFVARLSADDGNLTWHTFLGGSGLDRVWDIVAEGGAVYVAGLSTVGWGSPVQGYNGGTADAFAARLNGDNGALEWLTFIGGTGDDRAFAIASDGNGSIYLAGRSNDTWGSPVQSHTGPNNLDGFATQLNATNGNRDWNTFLGGSGFDLAEGIAADSASVYIVGSSDVSWGDPKRPFTGSSDAFAARLNKSDGVRLWHSFLGSASGESAFAVAVDNLGYVYVVGLSSANWGTPLQPHSGGTDVMIAWLDPIGTLVANTFLGDSGDDSGWGIVLDGSRNSYVTGMSNATWGSPVRSYSSPGNDAFVAKVPPSCFRSAESGLWSETASWVGGVVPTTTAQGACILDGHTITLDTSPQIGHLAVEAGGKLVMPLGFSLTVENVVYSAGIMEQVKEVNNANVPFLEIRNQAGTEVKYRGVNIQSSNDLGEVTVTVRELNEGEYCTVDGATSPAYARRCYEIVPENNNLSARVRLWSQNSDLNGILPAELSVYRWVPGWTPLTNRTSGTEGDYSYAEGDTTGFSKFLLGQQGFAPTAVTLQSISARGQAGITAVPLVLILLVFTGGLIFARRRSS
jgi:hypothetical protein